MKYTPCWQKKRMVCSFKHHPRHKAVKKIWITCSVSREALGARQANLSSRTREADVLSSGGMGEPSVPVQAPPTDWQPEGVWARWETLTCDWEMRSIPVTCLAQSSRLCCSGSSCLTSWFASPSAAVPHQQPAHGRAWALLRLNTWGNRSNECARSCLCSRFAVPYGPLSLPCCDWKCFGLGAIHVLCSP